MPAACEDQRKKGVTSQFHDHAKPAGLLLVGGVDFDAKSWIGGDRPTVLGVAD